MTYFDAASVQRGIRRYAAAAAIIFSGAGLAGCETGGSILGGSVASNETPVQSQASVSAAPIAKIALAPVIGAPDPVSKQLVSQLTSAVEKRRIAITPDRDAKADYMLRGYIVAARDKSNTKVSYIWDVTDPTGKRVNRVTGEEVVASTNPKDPWASVSATVTQNIADKTAAQLGSWLPGQKGAAVASGTDSSAAPAAVGGPTASQTSTQTASSGDGGASERPQRTAASSTATASIARSGDVAAMVPSVTGAPGDGNSALAAALQGELSRQGVAVTEQAAGATYRVEGKVIIGAAKEGKQAIQIDWRVKDPQGKALGTVSQKNEIPEGSLDGSWGKTADAAAAAAAQGIVKLLPQQRASN
ncbi:MAG: hypothetical protein ACKVP3_08375 [Hyphomicrobiaceae bacterium]